MTPLHMLDVIMERDPNSFEIKPTDTDYANFKRWVLAEFGQQAWDDYHTPNWGMFGTDPV